MAIDPTTAVSAYNAAVQRIGESAAGGATNPSAASFSSMVTSFAENAVETGKGAEKLSAMAAAGQADINQVVVAVAEAEATLNTVVAVRDRVMSAYREIIRMPI
jgi:flagellar hook-basal body complex protein FliE